MDEDRDRRENTGNNVDNVDIDVDESMDHRANPHGNNDNSILRRKRALKNRALESIDDEGDDGAGDVDTSDQFPKGE